MQASQVPSSTPPPGGDQLGRWLAFLALLTAAGAGLWAVVKFFGHPFLIWSHQRIHEVAYRDERAAAARQGERIDLLLIREFPDLFRQVLDMRSDLDDHQKAIAAFAETRDSMHQVKETAVRLETAITNVGDNMIKLMREVSEIRGAQRIHGEYRP